MKSWVCQLEEMKERFTFEKVLFLDSEGILLEKTIRTQRLTHLIWVSWDVSTRLQRFFFVPGLLAIFLMFALLRGIDHSLLKTIPVSNPYELVETSSQQLSLICIHFEFDIKIHLVLNFINSAMKVINHTPITDLIRLSDSLHSFSWIEQIFVKHFKLCSGLYEIFS